MSDLVDIKDAASDFSRLDKNARSLNKNLVTLGAKYINKMSGFGSPQNDEFFTLRDSLTYRNDAILFHLHLLIKIHSNAAAKYEQVPDLDAIPFIYSVTDEMSALFDSIVFHSCTLFDYCSNLVEYVVGKKLRSSLKWNGAVSAALDSSNPLSQTSLAPLIVRLHNDYVNKLIEHRSHLIHRRKDHSGFAKILNLTSQRRYFTIYAPKLFVKQIYLLKDIAKESKISMQYAAFWLVETVQDSLQSLVLEIVKYIDHNRKTDAGVFLSRIETATFSKFETHSAHNTCINRRKSSRTLCENKVLVLLSLFTLNS